MFNREREHWNTYKDVMDRSSIRVLIDVVRGGLKKEAEVEQELRAFYKDNPDDTAVGEVLQDYDQAHQFLKEMENFNGM